jgi:hypothetical protein
MKDADPFAQKMQVEFSPMVQYHCVVEKRGEFKSGFLIFLVS